MYWEIGRYINSVVLDGERAEYGKKIFASLAQHLSWSHFRELIRIKDENARDFYANDASERHLGVREMSRQISRKAYERQEIANSALTEQSTIRSMYSKTHIYWTLSA